METIESAVSSFSIPGAITHLYAHARSFKEGFQHTFVYFLIKDGTLIQTQFLISDMQDVQDMTKTNIQSHLYRGHGTILPVACGDREGLMLSVFEGNTLLISAMSWKDEDYSNVELESD